MARTYKIGSAEPKKIMMGFRTSQVVIVAVSCAFAFLFLAAGQLIMIFPIVGIGTILAFLPLKGRSLDEWIPIFMKWFIGGKKMRNSTAIAPLLGHGSSRSQAVSPPISLKGLKLLKVKNAQNEETAVLHDSIAGTYSATIEISGPSFVLESQEEQEQIVANWGSILARFSREGSVISRVQWIERTLPEDSKAMHDYFDTTAHVEVGNQITDAYLELIDSASPVTTKHRTYLVIQISQLKSAKQIKQAGGGEGGACEVLLRELQNTLSLIPSAGFNVLGVLDGNEMIKFIRTSFDPTADVSNSYTGTMTTNQLWPMAVETEWDKYHTDNYFHRTFWVSDFSRTEVGVAFLAPLMMQSSIRRTISVVMEPLAPSRALREVEVARTSFIADQGLRDKAGYIVNAQREREYEKLQQREQELTDGHGAYRFSAYVTCSAEDEEMLEYVSQNVEQTGHQAQLVFRLLYGEQASAFATCLPIARGLS